MGTDFRRQKLKSQVGLQAARVKVVITSVLSLFFLQTKKFGKGIKGIISGSNCIHVSNFYLLEVLDRS